MPFTVKIAQDINTIAVQNLASDWSAKATGGKKSRTFVKYWEIIADNLKKAGWSWGCVSAIDSRGRTIWIGDAHRDDGKRFIVRAYDKLTAFVELERAIHEFAVSLLS